MRLSKLEKLIECGTVTDLQSWHVSYALPSYDQLQVREFEVGWNVVFCMKTCIVLISINLGWFGTGKRELSSTRVHKYFLLYMDLAGASQPGALFNTFPQRRCGKYEHNQVYLGKELGMTFGSHDYQVAIRVN